MTLPALLSLALGIGASTTILTVTKSVLVDLFLAAVAIAASWLPARRAMVVDPVTVLRQE